MDKLRAAEMARALQAEEQAFYFVEAYIICSKTRYVLREDVELGWDEDYPVPRRKVANIGFGRSDCSRLRRHHVSSGKEYSIPFPENPLKLRRKPLAAIP
ncbi:hypothetical protein [Bradyrhizobium sp. LMTR 3]|uniref:hypothetical protein n=1 Tax=Bradyrhizobium sp. LMTR 3 TaxID=189873 RepID=UPI0008105056|nr:hypothetical protein [Bradyrhizobium sp. LMTR 3]OCK58822.1 hypothetical protein LMTR3_32170 [Bradyrhizobium sp. LMTR 3]